MESAKRIFALGLLLLPLNFAEGAAFSPSAPPRVCEVRQPSWCIYYSDAKIEARKPRSADYARIWTVRGSYWTEYPLLIKEPQGCRNGHSDTLQLVSFEKNFRWDQQLWIKMVVRLMKGGDCDLVLLSPTLSRDPAGSAFFAGLGLIQTCTASDCHGTVLGTKLRNLVDPAP